MMYIIVIIVIFVIIVTIVIVTITHGDVYIDTMSAPLISSHLKCDHFCDQSSNGHSGREGVHLHHTLWSHNVLTEKKKGKEK